MNESILRAARHVGSSCALANAIGVTPSAISIWLNRHQQVPIERCVQIERVTDGVVRRWHLRPEDWHSIWPELIAASGAPAVPAKESA